MSTIRLIVLSVTAAALISASTGAALASPAESPDPEPGTPSCSGLVVAMADHYSGPNGASGNPGASAGPGYFLGSSTADTISLIRTYRC